MAKLARELFEEAMKLDAVLGFGVHALDQKAHQGGALFWIEDAWRVEIERRMAELDSGAVQMIPWEALRARLCRR